MRASAEDRVGAAAEFCEIYSGAELVGVAQIESDDEGGGER